MKVLYRLSYTSVTQINSLQWMVTSSDSTRQYTICEDMKVCSINCHLQCNMCNICVHSFSCNCMDALINHTICKHIHLVAKQNKSTKIPPQNISINLSDCLPINEIHTSLLETTVEQQQVEVANIRRRVQEKLMIMMSQVEQCTNTEALLSAERNITSAMSVLNVIDNSTAHIATMATKQLHPSNKYISKQRNFFSTRSRHEKPKRRYVKPSRHEEE